MWDLRGCARNKGTTHGRSCGHGAKKGKKKGRPEGRPLAEVVRNSLRGTAWCEFPCYPLPRFTRRRRQTILRSAVSCKRRPRDHTSPGAAHRDGSDTGCIDPRGPGEPVDVQRGETSRFAFLDFNRPWAPPPRGAGALPTRRTHHAERAHVVSLRCRRGTKPSGWPRARVPIQRASRRSRTAKPRRTPGLGSPLRGAVRGRKQEHWWS